MLHKTQKNSQAMEFISICVRKDNLMYLFYTDSMAFSVDPSVPEAIMHALGCQFDRRIYTAAEIMEITPSIPARRLFYSFTTHGHYDHAGGDEQLHALSSETEFVSHESVKHGCIISTGPYSITCLHTPCHTKCSMCFLVSREGALARYLLTGDFIFKLGCGRFFEGTSSEFLRSVAVVYKYCTDETVLLYGHDYYETNLAFASQFYPIENTSAFFLPLGKEKKYNPFLNYKEVGIEGTPEEIIAELRRRKDEFK